MRVFLVGATIGYVCTLLPSPWDLIAIGVCTLVILASIALMIWGRAASK